MDLAENRPQQLVERQARWPQVRWHLIGQLQRNKAKTVLGPAALIHSVDSLRLAERLSNLAESPQRILCEVNVSGEATKSGFHAGRTSRVVGQSCWHFRTSWSRA